MKTSKLHIISATLLITFLLFSSFRIGVADHKYATMTVNLIIPGIPTGGMQSKIFIVYEDSTVEEIPLAKSTPETMSANTIKINQAVNSMAAKGYELVSFIGTSYIFVKK